MAEVTEARIKEIMALPKKAGSYEIENHLFGNVNAQVNQGCWIGSAQTTYGNMQIGEDEWPTYSVPIMAYLAHLSTVRVPSKVKHEQEVAVAQGYSSSFTASMEISISVASPFSAIAGGDLKLSTSINKTIEGSTTVTRELEMEGPGVFNIYQMHIVFAHFAAGAGKLSSRIGHSRELPCAQDERPFGDESNWPCERDSSPLLFFTSMATNTVVPVASEHSVSPLAWDEMLAAALRGGIGAAGGSAWTFDFTVKSKPGRCY